MKNMINVREFLMLCFILGSKFAVDLLKCDQNDENTLDIGKKLKYLIKKLVFFLLIYLRF